MVDALAGRTEPFTQSAAPAPAVPVGMVDAVTVLADRDAPPPLPQEAAPLEEPRVTPLHGAGAWDFNQAYEKGAIVTDDEVPGHFEALQDVPAGSSLFQVELWRHIPPTVRQAGES